MTPADSTVVIIGQEPVGRLGLGDTGGQREALRAVQGERCAEVAKIDRGVEAGDDQVAERRP